MNTARRNYTKMQRDLDKMRDDDSFIPQVDINKLYMVAEPLPHERAVLILARCYQREIDPDYVSVSWDCQVKAAAFYNKHGILDTLNECTRLDPDALK